MCDLQVRSKELHGSDISEKWSFVLILLFIEKSIVAIRVTNWELSDYSERLGQVILCLPSHTINDMGVIFKTMILWSPIQS
jgi:hypothetical protein